MTPRDLSAYLQDIVDACGKAAHFAAGRSYEDFAADDMLAYAVEHALLIAGEALAQALRVEPDLVHGITHAQQVVAFRNRLIHGYSVVDPAVVWEVATVHAPVLSRQAAQILAELTPGDPPC
jgi:uncharacterized protein with HEPN domain